MKAKAIMEMNVTKGELFRPFLDKGLVFDFAMPQDWLDHLTEKSGLDYGLIRSTTVWWYPPKDGNGRCWGMPMTVCDEVYDAIRQCYPALDVEKAA